jgi:hypothetical protein
MQKLIQTYYMFEGMRTAKPYLTPDESMQYHLYYWAKGYLESGAIKVPLEALSFRLLELIDYDTSKGYLEILALVEELLDKNPNIRPEAMKMLSRFKIRFIN